MPHADPPDMIEAPEHLVADTRSAFRRAALASLDAALVAHHDRIDIDLSRTREIDSSGLGVLVLLQKRASDAHVAMRLRNTPRSVRQLLTRTHLDALFVFED